MKGLYRILGNRSQKGNGGAGGGSFEACKAGLLRTLEPLPDRISPIMWILSFAVTLNLWETPAPLTRLGFGVHRQDTPAA